MEPETIVIIVLGMIFSFIMLTTIFRYAGKEADQKAAVKLEKERETTYREIAGYVANGYLPTEDAERLIRAMEQCDSGRIDQVRDQLTRSADTPAPPREPVRA